MNYEDFLKNKEFTQVDSGFDGESMWLPLFIKPFQRDCVEYACRRGRSALFADTGLGKTLMQLSWAHRVMEYTNKPVLVLAPLCVAQQTVREGAKFGISAEYMRTQKETDCMIHVTNYEMLKNFNPENYSGIVLDESSILKGMNGKLRKLITEFATNIPYRLSCTATPSPNDFMELGTQSEFLGIMSQTEMLATFFIHDGSDTSKWRLKGHARKKFWEWLATWAIVIRTPADLGYEDAGYDLPMLHIIEHVIETEATNGLFIDIAQGLQDRNKARRDSVDLRAEKAAEIMREWDCGIAWCNLNDESVLISQLTGACEVTGSMTHEEKELSMLWFMGDNDLELIGRKVRKCQKNHISKNTTKKTSKEELMSQENGNQKMQSIEKSICESTERKIPTNGNQPKKKDSEKMSLEESDTQKMQSIVKNKSNQLNYSISQTQKLDSTKDLNNMELMDQNTEDFCPSKMEDVQYADQKHQDAQSKKGSMLTTAIALESSEDCYAQTVIKELGNSKIPQNCSEEQQITSKKLLVSKPKIFGYGLNLQHCNKMAFIGLSDSWEAFYQAVRRCYRFGQDKEVFVHVIISDREGAVLSNIKRKREQDEQMRAEMQAIMGDLVRANIKKSTVEKAEYKPQKAMLLPSFLGV